MMARSVVIWHYLFFILHSSFSFFGSVFSVVKIEFALAAHFSFASFSYKTAAVRVPL
jgi:hypothetical protein